MRAGTSWCCSGDPPARPTTLHRVVAIRGLLGSTEGMARHPGVAMVLLCNAIGSRGLASERPVAGRLGVAAQGECPVWCSGDPPVRPLWLPPCGDSRPTGGEAFADRAQFLPDTVTYYDAIGA